MALHIFISATVLKLGNRRMIFARKEYLSNVSAMREDQEDVETEWDEGTILFLLTGWPGRIPVRTRMIVVRRITIILE